MDEPGQQQSAGTPEDIGKRFAEMDPSEVRESVKHNVRKGIAGIAGALEGFNEEVEQDHLPEQSEQAIHHVGETTRKITGATREETRETRRSIQHKKGE